MKLIDYLIDGDLMVQLGSQGEGYGGEFNPDDPDDRLLLRVELSESMTDRPAGLESDEWTLKHSFRTRFPVYDYDPLDDRSLIHYLLAEWREAQGSRSSKVQLEALSRLDPELLKEKLAEPITMAQFVARCGITLESTWIEQRTDGLGDDMPRGSNHYSLLLRYRDRTMATEYSMGPALCSEPECEEVLDAIASHSSVKWDCRNVGDFMDEFGYESYRQAAAIYEACLEAADKLIEFLGPELAEYLVYNVERL